MSESETFNPDSNLRPLDYDPSTVIHVRTIFLPFSLIMGP